MSIETKAREIIESNAVMAVDQRHDYDDLQDAFDSYYDNVNDSCDEIISIYARDLPFCAYNAYREAFMTEAKKCNVDTTDLNV